jgi:hypothetical protein
MNGCVRITNSRGIRYHVGMAVPESPYETVKPTRDEIRIIAARVKAIYWVIAGICVEVEVIFAARAKRPVLSLRFRWTASLSAARQ